MGQSLSYNGASNEYIEINGTTRGINSTSIALPIISPMKFSSRYPALTLIMSLFAVPHQTVLCTSKNIIEITRELSNYCNTINMKVYLLSDIIEISSDEKKQCSDVSFGKLDDIDFIGNNENTLIVYVARAKENKIVDLSKYAAKIVMASYIKDIPSLCNKWFDKLPGTTNDYAYGLREIYRINFDRFNETQIANGIPRNELLAAPTNSQLRNIYLDVIHGTWGCIARSDDPWLTMVVNKNIPLNIAYQQLEEIENSYVDKLAEASNRDNTCVMISFESTYKQVLENSSTCKTKCHRASDMANFILGNFTVVTVFNKSKYKNVAKAVEQICLLSEWGSE